MRRSFSGNSVGFIAYRDYPSFQPEALLDAVDYISPDMVLSAHASFLSDLWYSGAAQQVF